MSEYKRLPKPGESLAEQYPALASEWDFEKNYPLLPEQCFPKSAQRVFWKCRHCGNSWNALIHSRANGCGCPYCYGRIPIPGKTDAATLYPNIFAEWNHEKNKDLEGLHFTPRSGKMVWWKCEKGHEWQATLHHRTRGSKCPYCAGQKPIPGETDLLTTNPTLANEWNYARNGSLQPEHVMEKSSKKVWWQCKKGHEWQAYIDNRTIHKSGCPYCSGRKPIPGETDLLATNPTIASEWNHLRNANLTADQVTRGSRKKVWWQCQKGHEWRACISSRTILGEGCPYCARKIPVPGKTDIVTLFPTISLEWDYEKNKDIPENFSENSYKKVYWKCSICNHSWKATMANRTHGSGCPKYKHHAKILSDIII